MIEHLLKYDFPRCYNIPSSNVTVPITRHNQPFSETDSKACESCHANPRRTDRLDCNKEVLRVDNNGCEIAVIRFEEYIKQFEHTSANSTNRCDLIMSESGVSHEKIVFCDLCCNDEKYVNPNNGKYPEGKRAHARKQMMDSVNTLLGESLTGISLLTYPTKICLFAWRDYNVPDYPTRPSRHNARSNVQAFSTTVSSMSAKMTSYRQILEHRFVFMQIKYPTPYVW